MACPVVAADFQFSGIKHYHSPEFTVVVFCGVNIAPLKDIASPITVIFCKKIRADTDDKCPDGQNTADAV
jgi:hypothetical protein